jgi:hypothetical protein
VFRGGSVLVTFFVPAAGAVQAADIKLYEIKGSIMRDRRINDRYVDCIGFYYTEYWLQ